MSARVLVVGGGITGLTTAYALARSGAPVDVELRESDDRVGGKLRTSAFAGLPAVDEGADAFLARVPKATALAVAVGLGDELTSPTGATASVWYDGLHSIPDGLLLGVPAEVLRLARSDLLSVRGRLRAAAEPLLPRRGDAGDSIGTLVRARFGHEVHERLVDALVGSIYATDTDRFSLAMVPQLAGLAGCGRSLLLNARRLRREAAPATGPLFRAPLGGMAGMATAVAAAAADLGVTVRVSSAVATIAADGSRWRVDDEPFDAVVVTTPAAATAPLLAAAVPEAARLQASMDHAGVVMVTLAVDDWPERLTGRSGYLVPKPVQRTVTAVSFGSQKWAHWQRSGQEVLRVSLGRDGLPVEHLDDDEVLDRVVTEVGAHLAVDLQPTAVRISRWPASFPQYRPHHLQWLAEVEAALPAGLHVAGASYGGIGVPACITQAEAAAARVLADLAPT